MAKVVLKSQKREVTGKTKVKKIREKGLIPGVCYRDGKEPSKLQIHASDLYETLHTKAGGNVIINLLIEGAKTDKNVIIKEIQKDPVKDNIIHVDFKEISLTEKIKVNVPVAIHGEAKEVTSQDGVIEHIIWEVEVECLPTNIPEKIVVEIADMKIGDTILVKDLKIPEGIKVFNDPELVVITAKPPAKEEVKEEGAEEGLEEPEVIEKGKKAKEGEEGEETEEAVDGKKPEAKKEEKKEKKEQ